MPVLVGHSLTSAGWTFDTAGDGAEAWTQRVQPYLVSDINMPGISRIDLTLAT